MTDKLNFLNIDFPKLLAKLNAQDKGEWGVLNGQQMVEHMSDSVRIANGKDKMVLQYPPEKALEYKKFALSDRDFKQNTKNSLMSETPAAIRKSSMQEAIKELENELACFKDFFETNKNATLTNPFFGDMNFEEWTHLLHKHALHHCKQFRLV
ncbi:MAG: hypothetical protein H0V01_08315 [Bacteroidetes bacterium]|nr:hypothetical protein [Bacteroidota bacterium]HET6243711.1 hypothetical protein [Bacteroidia bacterium]